MKRADRVRLLLGTCVCLSCCRSARADTLVLSPSSLGSLRHVSGDNGTANDLQNLIFPDLAVRLKNYDTLQISVQAPAGQAWFIATDPSFITHSLTTRLAYNQFLGNPYACIHSVAVDFNLVEGDSSAYNLVSHEELIATSGDWFFLSEHVNISGDMAFSGFTVTSNTITPHWRTPPWPVSMRAASPSNMPSRFPRC